MTYGRHEEMQQTDNKLDNSINLTVVASERFLNVLSLSHRNNREDVLPSYFRSLIFIPGDGIHKLRLKLNLSRFLGVIKFLTSFWLELCPLKPHLQVPALNKSLGEKGTPGELPGYPLSGQNYTDKIETASCCLTVNTPMTLTNEVKTRISGMSAYVVYLNF